MHESLEWAQIFGERAAFQSVEIGFAIFRAHCNGRIGLQSEALRAKQLSITCQAALCGV